MSRDFGIEEPLTELEVGYINVDVDLPDEVIQEYLKSEFKEFAKIGGWVDSWGGQRRANSTLANQDRFTLPSNIFGQMKTASDAAKYDDIISNAVDITEQVAFARLGIETGDDESSDIGTQILDEVNMTQVMREIWRELFITSQCYIAVHWTRKNIRLKRKLKNEAVTSRKRRKVYKNLLVPSAISLLDPLKVIPVGNFLFGEERLAYIADPDESIRIEEFLAGDNTTLIEANSLFLEKYTPTKEEAQLISEFTRGGSRTVTRDLYILNPELVFRITLTRPSYQRFADVRLASVFEILDLKHNLRESDRSDILGNINSLVIVKKGSEKMPTTPAELSQTASQFKSNGRNSIVITDHRIEVEILTKKTDKTLQPERYNTLDSRLTSRVLQIFQTGNYAAGTATDNSGTLFKIVAASMNARREVIRDVVSNKIIEKIWERNEELLGEPELTFYPRRISLDFDHYYTTLLKELLVMGALSRETVLDELDIDFSQEMARIEAELDKYGPVQMNQNAANGIAGGALGGTQNGGGDNTTSYDKTPNKKSSSSGGSPSNDDK